MKIDIFELLWAILNLVIVIVIPVGIIVWASVTSRTIRQVKQRLDRIEDKLKDLQ